MIPAIIIGRKDSQGLPGKNWMHVLGRPLCWYPIRAARESLADSVVVATDSGQVADIAIELGATVGWLDPETTHGNSRFAFRAAFNNLLRQGAEIEMAVLMFCNSATVLPEHINEGILTLQADAEQEYDSAATVSQYNMWSPLRAHRIEDGLLKPYMDYKDFGEASDDRDSQGGVWYPDISAFVVRPKCFDYSYGIPPFNWMGRNVYPIKQWGGMDVDFAWQVPMVEYWLKEHGFSATETPYDILLDSPEETWYN